MANYKPNAAHKLELCHYGQREDNFIVTVIDNFSMIVPWYDTFLVVNLLILSFFYAVDLISYCLINLNLPKSTCRSLTKKTRWSSLKTSKCTYKNWALGNSFHKSGILIEACMVGYRCQYLSKETPPSICLPCKLPWFTLRAYVIIVYYMFADYQLSNRAKNRERSFHAM